MAVAAAVAAVWVAVLAAAAAVAVAAVWVVQTYDALELLLKD